MIFANSESPLAFGYDPKAIVSSVEQQPTQEQPKHYCTGVRTMMKLGEILIRKQLISLSELEQALTLQSSCSQKLGEILMGQGLIQRGDLEQALKEQYWRQNGFWVID
ncbi:hypothetical protein [Limnoraphis robusta]|nr:hypothetical protein [Limnoraphis robusta]